MSNSTKRLLEDVLAEENKKQKKTEETPEENLTYKKKEPKKEVVVRHRVFNGDKNKWSQWKNVVFREDGQKSWVHKFSNNGTQGELRVHPNSIPEETCQQVTEEIVSHNELFRRYKFQGIHEPRLHLMLHEDATSDFERPQPGYSHAQIFMKCHRMQDLPIVNEISEWGKDLCSVKKWNAGLDIVYYRDGKDRIGPHADDDQNETRILAVIPSSPDGVRVVVIQNKKRKDEKGHWDGDEELELFLGAGDAYDMDGQMQKFYTHSVRPNPKTAGNPDGHRIALVFRDGDKLVKADDTGEQCSDLSPRKVHACCYGRNLDYLEEGKIYRRIDMYDYGYHRMLQRGISGSQKDGCDSIIIGQRYNEECLRKDGFDRFTYIAEVSNGALGMLKTAEKGMPLRVFRSSEAYGPLKAVVANRKPKGTKGETAIWYRYDGLYKISTEKRHEVHIQDGVEPAFYFHLERMPVGDTNMHNLISAEQYASYCIQNKTLSLGSHSDKNLLKEEERFPVPSFGTNMFPFIGTPSSMEEEGEEEGSDGSEESISSNLNHEVHQMVQSMIDAVENGPEAIQNFKNERNSLPTIVTPPFKNFETPNFSKVRREVSESTQESCASDIWQTFTSGSGQGVGDSLRSASSLPSLNTAPFLQTSLPGCIPSGSSRKDANSNPIPIRKQRKTKKRNSNISKKPSAVRSRKTCRKASKKVPRKNKSQQMAKNALHRNIDDPKLDFTTHQNAINAMNCNTDDPNLGLTTLYKQICDSKDKLLFVIGQDVDGNKCWDLVEVDIVGSDRVKAETQGIYHCKWYIKHYQDSRTKVTQDCRFWPCIKLFDKKEEVFKYIIPIPPKKLKLGKGLGENRMWYQKEINLAEHYLVGPFNFNHNNKIASKHWNNLRKCKGKVNIEDISQVVSIPTI